MNIVNKLTIRHLKQNKRRTLVTIVGVIISVAMITAVATLGVSFLDLLKRESIATSGEWHVLYPYATKEQIKEIKADVATQGAFIQKDYGYARLDGSINEYKPYVFVRGYNEHGLINFPIEVIEGRLPQSPDEIVVSEHVATDAEVIYKIGDTLEFDIGERRSFENEVPVVYEQTSSLRFNEDGTVVEELVDVEARTFTVVGFIERPTWEPAWAPGYTLLTYVDEEFLGDQERADVLVSLKEVNRSLYKHADQLAEAIWMDPERVDYNSELLRYYGVSNNSGIQNMLYSLSAIIIGVIMIGSVSLIYNAFAISVSERTRHLGMLSSVGATNKQKRNSVFFEGAVIGLISIPIGLLAGLAGMVVTFLFINSMIQNVFNASQNLHVVVTPLSLVVATILSALTILISTYMPARKASKVSAIDAIRQVTDIKLTTKSVKTSRLVRKLFGIEPEIGLKNLKRNKRRYRATVFSLIISIVLFLAVSFFTSTLHRSLVLSQDGVDYDIQISSSSYNEEYDGVYQTIASMEKVTDSIIIKELTLGAWIEEKAAAGEWKVRVEQNPDIVKGGKVNFFIQVAALTDESLQAYADQIGMEAEELLDVEQPSAIVIDTMTYQQESGKFVETQTIDTEIGSAIELHRMNWETEETSDVDTVEVAAVTRIYPMGLQAAGIGGVNIIVSERLLDAWQAQGLEADVWSRMYLRSTDPMKTQKAIQDLREHRLHVYNEFQQRQSEEQMLLVMSVFTYGFIALITSISIANIFNTISTSIALRKREFAMLRSVGMTPGGFNKMINYESIFYGLQSLLYGLPISVGVMLLIYKSMMNSFDYSFSLPWISMLQVVIAVFIIVGASMLYSSAKVKKEDIIEGLRQESA